MARTTIYARTLQLARYLSVPMPDLFAWMRPGAVPPPTKIFLKAVDLVLNDCDEADESRAQRIRVAAHHNHWVTSRK